MNRQHKLEPIRLDTYKPLRDVVSEALRQAIREGVLQPGERLMEIQLADELGVSRTPIREAIRKLELEGFVVMVPRRGTYVADISLKDVVQVFEIRSALEERTTSTADRPSATSTTVWPRACARRTAACTRSTWPRPWTCWSARPWRMPARSRRAKHQLPVLLPLHDR